jgi:hypothetical protein
MTAATQNYLPQYPPLTPNGLSNLLYTTAINRIVPKVIRLDVWGMTTMALTKGWSIKDDPSWMMLDCLRFASNSHAGF